MLSCLTSHPTKPCFNETGRMWGLVRDTGNRRILATVGSGNFKWQLYRSEVSSFIINKHQSIISSVCSMLHQSVDRAQSSDLDNEIANPFYVIRPVALDGQWYMLFVGSMWHEQHRQSLMNIIVIVATSTTSSPTTSFPRGQVVPR